MFLALLSVMESCSILILEGNGCFPSHGKVSIPFLATHVVCGSIILFALLLKIENIYK